MIICKVGGAQDHVIDILGFLHTYLIRYECDWIRLWKSIQKYPSPGTIGVRGLMIFSTTQKEFVRRYHFLRIDSAIS